ncbi:exopolyphosphatase [Clostridia bacterium]|nr:exopolyphosphatase [Clostridia bacterium]
MKIKTFASIYIGSYGVTLKIFELIPNQGVKTIDHIRTRLELGSDIYKNGNVGYEVVEDLCQVLSEFYGIMTGYQVSDYRVYAGHLLREADNELFVLDQIKIRTRLEVQVISNSEHRFITYQALVANDLFHKMTQEGAAVADIGGGSIQLTLYQRGELITTQHIDLGILRLRERLFQVAAMVSNYERHIEELVDKELSGFQSLYLKGESIKYVILIGDYIGEMIGNISRRKEDDTIEADTFLKRMNKFGRKNPQLFSEELTVSKEADPLMAPSVILCKNLVEELKSSYVWVPGVDVSDGIAYEYVWQNRFLKVAHDFDRDILSAAGNLAGRYGSDTEHTGHLLTVTKILYDAMKKLHGMGKREALLLSVATILHDCGRYISMTEQAECSYQIIMASEIIGMSHLEREIVASTVKYNAEPLVPYEELMGKMDQKSYMVVAKLSAILRVANVLDRSHRQKLSKIRAMLKDRELIITAESRENIVLEKSLFSSYAVAFEKVFSVKPVLREKRMIG